MPGGNENHMYSFNLGPVHFIGFSTEAYYFLDYGLKLLVNQYEWLERDLIEANRPENRQSRPWIVTFGHRPMYCSNDNDKDCRKLTTLIRVGLPLTHFFGLEDLFYNYGVDVEIWAHQHSYERLWPIYNYTVLNGSYAEPYKNPKAPVHLVTGSAGCKEGHAEFLKKVPAWSAFHSVVSVDNWHRLLFSVLPFLYSSHLIQQCYRTMDTLVWRHTIAPTYILNKCPTTRTAKSLIPYGLWKINRPHRSRSIPKMITLNDCFSFLSRYSGILVLTFQMGIKWRAMVYQSAT